MRIVSRTISAVMLVALVGCRGGSEKAVAPAASSSSARPASAGGVDAALLKELQDLARTCGGGAQLQCPDGANWRLASEFLSGQRDRVAALATITTALADPDPKLKALAANILNKGFRDRFSGSDNQAPRVTEEVALALFDTTLTAPPEQRLQALPAAVNAMMLASQRGRLYTALGMPEHASLRAVAYPQLMVHGRLAALPKVQELVRDADVNVALYALEAPLGMSDWSADEQAAICQWADELMADMRPGVASKVSLLLARCSGAYVDKLLERTEKQLALNAFDEVALAPLGALCGGGPGHRPSNATADQCARARKILVAAAESAAVPEKLRVRALLWVAEFWPDQQALKLAKRLERDASSDVARGARAAAERLAATAKPQH